MPTIIKRGGRYLVRVRKQGFKPVSQSFIKKSDAQSWGRRVEADMEAGRWKDLPTMEVPTLKDAVTTYQAFITDKLKGARDYRYGMRDIQTSPMGGIRVDRLEPSHLAQWRDAMTAKGLKSSTVARKLVMLSGLLTWCQNEQGWIEENPMRKVRKPVVRDARTRILSDDEVRYLRIALAGSRAKWLPDAITVLMRSAMRRSELVGLRCEDVHLDRGVATLHDTKNGEGRDVPLCPEARAALRRLLDAATASKAERVLPIEDPEAVSFAFRRAVVRARARYEEDCAAEGRTPEARFMINIRLHDLRHHSISEWARSQTMSVFDLMRISGHKSPKMLARYVNITSEEVAARMGRVTTEPGATVN